MNRLIEWNELELRVRADRIQTLVSTVVSQKEPRIEALRLLFADGELRVSGKVRKLISIPFEVAIRRIIPGRGSLRAYLEGASAFGFLPLPKLLLHLTAGRQLPPGIEIDAVNGAVVIALDRFLPSFVDATIEQIHITKDGILLRLGEGGADPPLDLGGIDGNA